MMHVVLAGPEPWQSAEIWQEEIMIMGLSAADIDVATRRHDDAMIEGLRQQRSAQHRAFPMAAQAFSIDGASTPASSLSASALAANGQSRPGVAAAGRQRGKGMRLTIVWSRSSWRCATLIALLLAIVGSILSGVAAQEATPAIGDPAVAELATVYTAAWSSGDAQAVSALYTDDAHFAELVLGGVVTEGHSELEAYAGAAFAAFSDFAITVNDGFAAGDRVAIEWVLSGSYTGQFGDLPPGTGQMVEVPGASILILEDGQIAEQREYWDVATLLAQVGALPGPAE